MIEQDFTQEEIFRYSRHLLIPEVGLEGQKRLKDTSVLVIGAGGLGSPAALYLAAAGIGRLGLVDDDVVEASNLQRQILHGSAQIGRPKVNSGRDRLSDLNPSIKLDTYCESFNQKTAADIASGYDILVDCSDNFATRYLVNDLCALTGRPDVFGAVYRFEGQVSVFDARRGPCYRCLFPDPPAEGVAPTCGEAGVLGAVPGVIGTLQAVEVIKLALGVGDPLIGKFLVFDALEMSFKKINLSKRTGCLLCGEHPEITELIDYESFCAITAGEALDLSEMITAKELAVLMKTTHPPLLLDVRTPVEAQVSVLKDAVTIPLEHLAERMSELDNGYEIVVFCRTGTRSRRALKQLKAKGFTHVKNLTGGINAWAQQVDHEMFQY